MNPLLGYCFLCRGAFKAFHSGTAFCRFPHGQEALLNAFFRITSPTVSWHGFLLFTFRFSPPSENPISLQVTRIWHGFLLPDPIVARHSLICPGGQSCPAQLDCRMFLHCNLAPRSTPKVAEKQGSSKSINHISQITKPTPQEPTFAKFHLGSLPDHLTAFLFRLSAG